MGGRHLNGGAIRLPAKKSKTKNPRTITVRAQLVPIISRRKAARRLDCDLIFHRGGKSFRVMTTFFDGEKERTVVKGAFPDWAYRRFKTAAKAIGKSDLRPQDLRRSAVRNLTRARVHPHTVMQIRGT